VTASPRPLLITTTPAPILCLRRTHEAAASSLPALASPSAPLLRPVVHLLMPPRLSLP
jgi:hypothetical protein